MFSLGLASPTRAKHALKTSLPFSASPSTAAGTASSMKGSHRRSISATFQTTSATRDGATNHYHTLAGPLFAPASRSPRPTFSSVFTHHGRDSPSASLPTGSPRAAYFQNYVTEVHPPLLEEIACFVAQNPNIPPPSPLLASHSPKVHLKSCLKSPMIKSPRPDVIKSPRFVPDPVVIVRSNDGPLWRKVDDLEGNMDRLTLEDRRKDRYGTLGGGYEEEWKRCTERAPTPFEEVARPGWLDSVAGLSGQQANNDLIF
ncbi:hypothetical protein FRB91_009220 [Serendipita sp. 411]|nr:hypothetical protein FRB91_009220 [Serendipita sp. 411]KAG9021143.1 hypothetical protein FS842_006787 [Serendipita sp. 407]